MQWKRWFGPLVLRTWKMLGVFSSSQHTRKMRRGRECVGCSPCDAVLNGSLTSLSVSWALLAYSSLQLGVHTWDQDGVRSAHKGVLNAEFLPVLLMGITHEPQIQEKVSASALLQCIAETSYWVSLQLFCNYQPARASLCKDLNMSHQCLPSLLQRSACRGSV